MGMAMIKDEVGGQSRRTVWRNRSRLRTCCSRGVIATLCLAAIPATALAQSASPGSSVAEIIVIGQRNLPEERIEALSGGADIVSTDAVATTANPTVSRALATVPGVIVQDFFGGNDQPRIQIRGSGLQQNPVERGVLVLQDGLPINRADGSYVVGLANPAQAEAIEVYRGYLANRLGATVLGGALNLVSPTGRSAPGAELSISGGNFGQFGALGQFGWAEEGYDALLQADISRRDGYREYNDSRRVRVGGNLGAQLNDDVAIRFFTAYTDLGFDVSGPLTVDLLKSDPESVFTGPTITPSGPLNPGPNVVRDRPRRDSEQFLIGTRLTGTFGNHAVDVAAGYTHTDDAFRFPIPSGTRETEGNAFTGVLRYSYKPDAASILPLFEVTAQYVNGSADRDYFINLSGEQGAQFAASKLDADTLSLNAGFHIPFGPVTLSPSVAWSHANRDNQDVFTGPTRPTAAYNPGNPSMALPAGAVPFVSSSFARDYEGWSPALGFSWRPNDEHLFFAAISRSFEPPTHDDLLATINGTPNSSAGRPNPGNPALPAAVFATPDLEAQRATTLEAGWRGKAGILSWDAVVYYSWVENELLSLRDESGTSLGAINADKTRHFGIEAGLTIQPSPRFTGQIVYNFQDFRFHDDPLRGDNRLAGAPRYWLYASATYAITDAWTAQANLRWVMEKTPVDNLNTVFNDPYAVVDLRSEYRISETFSVFGEVTNLFDENYASSTLIVDQARPDQAAYLPGDGRGFFAGVTLNF